MKKYLTFISIAFIGLTVIALTTAEILACLEVGMPIGTPLDWIHKKLPKRTSTGEPAYKLIPTVPEKKPEPKKPSPDDNTTRMLFISKTNKMACSYAIPFDPFSLDVAASADMENHIPWVMEEEDFSPSLDRGFRRVLIVSFVRMMLYPDSCPTAQTAQYFLEIGQPSLVGANAAIKAEAMTAKQLWNIPPRSPEIGLDPYGAKRVAQYLIKQIGDPAEQPPPEAPEGKTYFETMVHRLVMTELGEDYYYSSNVNFAYRLRFLDKEIAPYVIDAA
ncbi:MAG: hypothetical protein KAI63_06595 [Planctomycetes bacterium]|nr:hypothetical protein [Planctomycetota bacterium]